MKASDLPESTRQEILTAIRSKISSYEYDNLINKLGEDGLIEAALEAGKAQALSGTKKKKSRDWSWTWAILFWVVIPLIFVAILGEKGWKVGFIVGWGIFWIIRLILWFIEKFGNLY